MEQIGNISIQQMEQPGGHVCPHCTQLAKIYRRNITRPMAEGLVKLSQLPSGFHHYKQFKEGTDGDFAKLLYWGLIEPAPNDRVVPSSATKRNNGFWAITQLGIDFVLGIAKVPMYARVYNAKLLGLVGEQVGIADCMEDFNFTELMER